MWSDGASHILQKNVSFTFHAVSLRPRLVKLLAF